jgi:predicted molibdopterin-dependent oxidoreductase YjgC
VTETIELKINGQSVKAESGMTILEAALRKGIYIPHLCHHRELEPVGACRLCLVEVDGWQAISCKQPVKSGMVVRTETPEIQRIRQINLELVIADHDTDCLACAQNTQCALQRAADHIGINKKRLDRLKKRAEKLPIDDSNPFFNFDPNRCVLCGICVRTCDELQNIRAIDYIHRGVGTKVAGFGDRPRAESNCESCGECIVRCPVGALTEKDYLKPTHKVKTICSFCGCGCGLQLGVRDDKLVSAQGDVSNKASKGRLCVKGRFGYKFVNSPERLSSPLVKRDGKFVEVEWEEALDLVADNFSKNKGEKFATIASAKATNEDNYVLQKFTRAVMGTNNLDHCARL